MGCFLKKQRLFSFLLTLTLIYIFHYAKAQSGPGGIGDTSGTSNLVLWLRSDQGVLNASALPAADGESIATWEDQSGYNYHAATGPTSPVFDASNAGFSNVSTITFAGGGTEFLFIEDDGDEAPALDNTSEISIIYVYNPDNSTGVRAHISKRDGFNSGQSYVAFENSNQNSRINNNSDIGTAIAGGNTYINSITYQDGDFSHFLNQSDGGGVSGGTATIPNNDSDFNIGAFENGDARTFDGDIAEIIVLRTHLNSAQRIVVESYLASKYGISLTEDHWDEATYALYDNEIAGIGQDSDGEVANEATSAVLSISGGSDRVNNEWLFWGHDNGDFSSYSSDEIVSGASHTRLAREWVVNETNDLGEVTISFEQADLPSTGVSNPAFYLLVDSDGDANFSNATAHIMLTSGSGHSVSLDLNDGDHLAIAFEDRGDPEVWYSYISGDWSDPNTWTLDGAISAQYVNPSNRVPALVDSVVIQIGKTVTMDVDGVELTRLEVLGTLDLNSTVGHDFGNIVGNGKMRLSGAMGVQNYPTGDDSGFYDSNEGGTLEIYGGGIELDSDLNANNLLINMSTSTDEVILTGTMLNVFGEFNVSTGFFQFNSDLATNPLEVNVFGNLFVSSSGGIDVGMANARHELNLHSDFTNQGDVDFTNRSSQLTDSEATDGIVDVNFVSSSQDQTVLLQNTTDFYRLEVNKGTDDTYIVDISADDPSYFNLYGFANQSTNTPQASTNNNALGLIFGTIKVGNNITISPLNAGGNYSVYEGSQIWVNGGIVEKVAGTAIVPYGKLRVSAGELNAPINSGITTRENGQLTIEGGTVSVNQFRTSINGVTAQGGLIMTGGIFNIIGGFTSTNYYTFSLTYPGNIFNMSGGTINLSGSNSRGGIYINSSDENISVTGGEVNLDVTNNNNLSITSRAPFFNMNVFRSNGSATGEVRISSGTSGTGAGETSLNPARLKVVNDIRINNSDGNSTTFNANNFDINITGSLIIDNGSVVDFTGMKFTMEGVGGSTFDIGTASALLLDTLIIDKVSGLSNVNILNGASTALSVEGLLDVKNGNFDIATFDVTANGSVNVSDTIGTETSTGQLYLNGAAAQAITSSSGVIYDLAIDNANGVSLSGDLVVQDSIVLDAGIFDINTSKLLLTSEVITSSSFSDALMIQTDGNASDGGLEYYFDGTVSDPDAILYPIGTDANSTVRYTPATLDLSGVSDDGFIGINMADNELGTVDLSAVSSNLLTYYWKVGHRDFGTLPTVQSLVFLASDSDDPDGGGTPAGLPTDFVPGKVLDGSPFTRSQESDTDIAGLNISFDGSGAGFTLENANYTAGDGTTTLFSGAPDVYYTTNTSRQDWDNETKWTLTPDGIDDGATGVPGAGDVAILKNYGNSNQNHWVNVNSDITVAELIFDNDLGGFMPRFWMTDRDAILDLGPVSGEGEFFIAATSTEIADFTGSTDLGAFSDEARSVFNFRIDEDNQTVNMPNDISVYPNIRIEAENGVDDDDNRILQTSVPIVINGNVLMDRSPRFRINHDVSVLGDVRVTWQENRTTLELGDDREVTLEIQGDLLMENGAGDDGARFVVKNDNQNSYEHTVKVGGAIFFEAGLDGTSEFDLYNGAAPNNNAILELNGEGNFNFSNLSSATLTPDLYRVVMNKGTDTTTTFSFDANFTLNGDNTAEPQAIELQNGKLILNSSDINLALTDGSDFSIPPASGLEVTQGTVTSSNANIILDGLLRVNGGTLDLDSTDIEYSTSGSAIIEISSGVLEVGGQVRRSTSSTAGVLKYRQTGGDVDIATDNASVSSRASFEVLNMGSEFTLTGGTFNIERGVVGNSNESLELEPSIHDLSGSTITLFENLGTNYGEDFFNINAAIPLNNLTIAGSVDLPDARVYIRSLAVNDLTINANQTLLANDLDVTINGNFSNSGAYSNTSSNTILGGSGAQLLSGPGSFTIFNLTKTGAGTTTSSVNLDLGNDLSVLEGTLDMGSSNISLQNDAFIESILTNSSGNGLIFNGTEGQNLYGLSNNTVTLGTVTINNINGVDIPDGNGYNFEITQELRLDGGVFNIGGSLVTMKAGSSVSEVSAFNVGNMIQTNSSFTDNGFVIEFHDVAADTVMFFPIGELKYTPVSFSINTGATAGSIRVRPANERHPAVVNNIEPMGETEIDDTQNSLQYYWVVQAENTTGVQGTATFFYDHDDILAVESDTMNFISGRLLSNGTTWDKFAPTLFNGGNQTFTIPLNTGGGVTAAEITGDYTAGLGSTDGINNDIEGALPDELAVYNSNFTGSGNFSSDANWTPVGATPVLSSGIGPFGAQIVVSSGDTINLDISNIRLYSVEIEEGGVLEVPSGSVGNRLGIVTGSGTIVLNDTELLPTGEYSGFLACDGGVLQYAGSTSFSVLSGISQIRKVVFSGSGTRTMPNNSLTVCDTLLIDGPTVAFSSGQTYSIGDALDDRLEIQAGDVLLSNGSTLDVSGDFSVSGGVFTGANGTILELEDDLSYTGGTLDWNGTDVFFNGATEQLVDGDFTGMAAFRDLTIINTSTEGITVNTGGIGIDGVLTFTDGLINTSSSEMLTITSTGDWVGASTASYVTGPITKDDIAVASTYEFPVGKAARYAPTSIVNVGIGGQDWTSEYFTSTNPTYPNTSFDTSDPGSGFNELSDVIAQDRWEINSSGSNNAQIRLTYGTHHSIADINDLRVVWWDAGDSRWENQGGSLSGNVSGGTVTSENSIGFSTQQFALGQAPEIPLPVEMIYFNAKLDNGKVELEWATSSEIDNDRFEVERSYDGKVFEKIGIVKGNGTSNKTHIYNFSDEELFPGNIYYRLRQVDFDGKFEYSELVTVFYEINNPFFSMRVFPNPANANNVNLKLLTEDTFSPVTLSIHDMSGRSLVQLSLDPEELVNGYRITPDENVSKGLYLMIAKQGKRTSQFRFMIK